MPRPTCSVTYAISAPRVAACVQDLRREVQAGGGRGHGASLAREDGLVALAVGGLVAAA